MGRSACVCSEERNCAREEWAGARGGTVESKQRGGPETESRGTSTTVYHIRHYTTPHHATLPSTYTTLHTLHYTVRLLTCTCH